MNQDVSSEMEELKAELRLLDEKRRRLQDQEEKRLQQVIRVYEKDREIYQKDIANKELAIQELEAKYNEEMRIKRKALQDAVQHGATRKREHKAEVEQLNQSILAFKRIKASSEELPVRLAFPSVITQSTIYLFGSHYMDICTHSHKLAALILHFSPPP